MKMTCFGVQTLHQILYEKNWGVFLCIGLYTYHFKRVEKKMIIGIEYYFYFYLFNIKLWKEESGIFGEDFMFII